MTAMDESLPDLAIKGRGAVSNRSGRFEPYSRVATDDGWSGAAETWFTVDPEADLFAVFMGQNFDWPGATYDLQSMAYAALK